MSVACGRRQVSWLPACLSPRLPRSAVASQWRCAAGSSGYSGGTAPDSHRTSLDHRPLSATSITLIKTLDGRVLEAFTGGTTDGVPLILHHGTPSCGMLYQGWVEACAERGLRLIGYSRPGYGGSERHEGRTMADCVADVEAVAHALRLDRLYVLGHS